MATGTKEMCKVFSISPLRMDVQIMYIDNSSSQRKYIDQCMKHNSMLLKYCKNIQIKRRGSVEIYNLNV